MRLFIFYNSHHTMAASDRNKKSQKRFFGYYLTFAKHELFNFDITRQKSPLKSLNLDVHDYQFCILLLPLSFCIFSTTGRQINNRTMDSSWYDRQPISVFVIRINLISLEITFSIQTSYTHEHTLTCTHATP